MITWIANQTVESLAAYVTIAGFLVIYYQIRLSRIATAHAALADLSAELANCSERLGQHQRANDRYLWRDELTRLLNLLEVTCAVIDDGMAKGSAGAMILDSVTDISEMLDKSDDALEVVRNSTNSMNAFSHLYRFILVNGYHLTSFRVALSYINTEPPKIKMRARPWLDR